VSAREFAVDYLLSEVMSKYPNLRLDVDREKVALEKFKAAEEQCRLVNLRFSQRLCHGSTGYTAESVISTARVKIAKLLGDFSLDEVEGHFGFGPGASTRLKRMNSDVAYKLSGKPEVAPRCDLLANLAISRVPQWHKAIVGVLPGESPTVRGLTTVVAGNRITTVPKNAKTDRIIAIEPDMNMFVQKGIGQVIRQRLKRVKINLDDQTLNQRLAREGSLSDDLATIDLSAASDTIILGGCAYTAAA
jgi:hypothetical protein